MKQLIIVLALTGIFAACNSSDTPVTQPLVENATTTSDKTATDKKDQLKAIDSDEALIATALMAAPAASREGCTVIGYNMAGEFVTLKAGDNEFICLADDPKKEGFSAACYHKSLEPFMARGRALRSEGKSATEIFDIREEEVKSGKLSMGKPGSTLHLYFGKQTQYNPETNEVAGAHYRYVVYIPWATSESTGLPETPNEPNHPWIMNPGTHRAHIMITPLVGE